MRGAYHPRATEEQTARILKLKKQGLSTAIVSRRLGLSVWTINSVVRKEKEKKDEKGIRSQPRMSRSLGR